ncbi:CRISP/Allergen/PR-1-like [Pollicipes pollicipes]|uniref:CRISP/Allergen/PR-1-like n=1 Tax=Pollicipes pollicipes TaxID=41117 RepID=UPI00188493D8|nr:CRISP/Allergen/PR-1-like [Pollicipes pollicipes]
MMESTMLMLASLLAVASAQSEYCRFTPKHTLCQFQGTGPHCDQLQAREVSAQEARYIVAEHNELRAKVASGRETRGKTFGQPSAANMNQLEWDDELAKVAQRFADQCMFGHDCLDCRRVARFKVGQNVYSSSSTRLDNSPNWRQALYAWYDEVARFNPQNIEPFVFSSPLGHYTQLVWAKTSRIGCGYTLYKEGPWWTKLYVCDYGSTGNFQDGQMYERGAPCSRCPSGTSCSNQYHGLCTGSSNNIRVQNKPVTSSPPAQVPGVGSPPVNANGQRLFTCDLDHDGCRVKFVGTTWKIIHTDSPQGRILGTAVTSGRTSELTFQQLVVPPRDGSLCLKFAYLKYELGGDAGVDLVISLEPLGGAGQRLEYVEHDSARGQMVHRAVQLDHVMQPFQVRAKASVPAWAFGQATVLALDDLELVAGPCSGSGGGGHDGFTYRDFF